MLILEVEGLRQRYALWIREYPTNTQGGGGGGGGGSWLKFVIGIGTKLWIALTTKDAKLCVVRWSGMMEDRCRHAINEIHSGCKCIVPICEQK